MVKTPLFPSYIKAQLLLKAIDNKSEQDFKEMRNSISELVGTPQKPVDWTNPECYPWRKTSNCQLIVEFQKLPLSQNHLTQ